MFAFISIFALLLFLYVSSTQMSVQKGKEEVEVVTETGNLPSVDIKKWMKGDPEHELKMWRERVKIQGWWQYDTDTKCIRYIT